MIKASDAFRRPKQEWLAAARAAMEIEAASLARAAGRLGGELVRAVDLILAHPGKVVVTGIGKSGHIARKIVATFCSTGTAAVFLHPAEAVHGDLGIYTPGDPNGSDLEERHFRRVAGAGAAAARIPIALDRILGQQRLAIGGAIGMCCWTPRWSARPTPTIWRPRPAPSPRSPWGTRWPSR